MVAAVLTMVGYSLNDTIIIFDRVRENLHKHKQESFRARSSTARSTRRCRAPCSPTAPRWPRLLALSIFGGEVIRPFALVMLFGVFVGTFSSIYIASPVLLAIEQRWPGPAARGHLGPQEGAGAGAAAGSRRPSGEVSGGRRR